MEDKNLLLIISQPRSGSSLLQQLILTNPNVTSSPETWQMLSLVSSFRNTNLTGEYNPRFASINFNRHLETLNKGKAEFKNDIREIALKIYSKNLNSASYYIDKTPRNYHIIDELYEFFPNAKFIFLIRNPLSVFASILNYNFKGDFFKMLNSPDRIDDLFLAPKNIKKATKIHSNLLTIKYEDLINKPKKELQKIYNYLDLKDNVLTTYELDNNFKNTSSVDKKSLFNHNSPVANYLDAWKKVIDSSQKKKLALAYLEKLQIQGDYFQYNLNEIYNEVKAHTPKRLTYFSIPFKLLAQKEENLSILQLNKKRLLKEIQKLQGL